MEKNVATAFAIRNAVAFFLLICSEVSYACWQGSSARYFARVSCSTQWHTQLSPDNVCPKFEIRKFVGTSKTPTCYFSSDKSHRRPIPNIEYDEIKALPQHPEKLLIDVREPHELAESGVIPTSINIPLDSVSIVLAADVKPQIFQKKYGRSKPTKDSEIIFTCRSGSRALKAAEIASAMGFNGAKVYGGSWQDWTEKENLLK